MACTYRSGYFALPGACRDILLTLNQKLSDATKIHTKYVDIEISPERIPVPAGGEAVTLENVALLHTSFVRPDKTQQFRDGMTYYQIEVVVVAPAMTLDRIERVTYHLDPTYPEPVKTSTDRASRFKLKELANGTSIVRADIQLRGQDKPLHLNRFIDLRPDGPHI